jgi:hypothetical protein
MGIERGACLPWLAMTSVIASQPIGCSVAAVGAGAATDAGQDSPSDVATTDAAAPDAVASDDGAPPPAPTYAHPEAVAIEGYTGPQEDPVMSPDGLYLFFDSHNDSGLRCYLYWAKRVDYKTFQFMGEVQGVNFPGALTLRGNYDLAHEFYFESTYYLSPCGMIAHGTFKDGAVTNIAPVHGICPPAPKAGDTNVTFDVAISPDGNSLYHTDATINGTGPLSSHIHLATRKADGSFGDVPDSDTLFENVNALSPLVYNSAPTPDGLAFFFTAVQSRPVTYVATRASISDAFGSPERVTVADALSAGLFSEMGGVAPDGQYLYFHRVLSPSTSAIYVLSRL